VTSDRSGVDSAARNRHRRHQALRFLVFRRCENGFRESKHREWREHVCQSEEQAESTKRCRRKKPTGRSGPWRIRSVARREPPFRRLRSDRTIGLEAMRPTRRLTGRAPARRSARRISRCPKTKNKQPPDLLRLPVPSCPVVAQECRSAARSKSGICASSSQTTFEAIPTLAEPQVIIGEKPRSCLAVVELPPAEFPSSPPERRACGPPPPKSDNPEEET